MNEQQSTQLRRYLESVTSTEFAWGEFDCNTFVGDAYDAVYGTDEARKNGKGTYSDMRGAIAMRFDLNTWCESVGYTEITENYNPQDGDVLVGYNRPFTCGHIYYNNKIFTIDQNHQLVAIPIERTNKLSDQNIRYWRK